MAATQKIFTKVQHIYMTPWDETDSAPSSEPDDKLELLSIIADTVSITQDDVSTDSIDSETRDEPIMESVTLGNYTVAMDSADISYDILEKLFGFSKIGTDPAIGAAAPASYVKRYCLVEVEFADGRMILPRVLMTSKIDASSLKTNVAKGTVSGTCYSAKVTVGENDAVTTPFLIVDASQKTVTVAKL